MQRLTDACIAYILCLSCCAYGCGWPEEPDVGPLRAGLCMPDDSNPRTEVSFSRDIQPLFNRGPQGCSCHLREDGGLPTALQVSGLDLSRYETLLAGGLRGGPTTVIPGQPCNSTLLLKLSSTPPFGDRMPSDGPPYWTPQERSLLRDWIAEGARNN